jgi:hypothetical protein
MRDGEKASGAPREVPPLVVLVRAFAPYPDPRARRRTRRAARSLVTVESWPGDDATNAELAQLALMRLLWLQRECRRAGRRGHVEAAVLLSRTAIETMIVGLWMLHTPEPIPNLQRQSAKSLKSLLGFITGPDLVPAPFFDKIILTIGQPGSLPTTRDQVAAIQTSRSGRIAGPLYANFYQPLSTLFSHGSPFALLRHVDDQGRVVERPAIPWSRRYAVHMTDACVGLLAADIAAEAGLQVEQLIQYGDAHRDRLITPGAILAMRGTRKGLRWSRIPAAVGDIRAMRRILGSIATDASRTEAVEQLSKLATSVYDKLCPDIDPEIRDALVAAMIEQLRLAATDAPPAAT